MRDSVRTIEPKFEEKHVGLSVDSARSRADVRGDAARLRQVAGEPAVERGEIHRQRRAGRRALSPATRRLSTLVVSDTGIGIHPDFLPHVFEQFRQGDADATTGLGLGLAIVKNLVELHGGTVVAASDGIGRGSRFTVTLPRTASAAS